LLALIQMPAKLRRATRRDRTEHPVWSKYWIQP
jgi:hypothetical protein